MLASQLTVVWKGALTVIGGAAVRTVPAALLNLLMLEPSKSPSTPHTQLLVCQLYPNCPPNTAPVAFRLPVAGVITVAPVGSEKVEDALKFDAQPQPPLAPR